LGIQNNSDIFFAKMSK